MTASYSTECVIIVGYSLMHKLHRPLLVLLPYNNVHAGNITGISVQYDRARQTIACTTSGGPATEVAWFKDNEKIMFTKTSSGGLYEHSQVITNTISATYENRLRIVDKSSKVAGTYTCEVTNLRGSTNGSLCIQGIL